MAARPSGSKRASTAVGSEPAVQTPLNIHASAVIADKAQITGKHPVEIGEGSVLHPYARIRSDGGKIVIGKNCTVWENAEVGWSADAPAQEIVIGDRVSIETGASVQASSIGNGSIVGIGVRVGRGVRIGQQCKITPFLHVDNDDELADFTIVYGNGQRRRDQTVAKHGEVRTAKEKGQMMQIGLMQRLIPHAAAKYG